MHKYLLQFYLKTIYISEVKVLNDSFIYISEVGIAAVYWIDDMLRPFKTGEAGWGFEHNIWLKMMSQDDNDDGSVLITQLE